MNNKAKRTNILKSIIVFFLLAFSYSYSQERPNYYVQFRIISVASVDEAQAIDKKMEGKKGIVTTHADHVTSTYFCTMNADAEYVFDDFEAWFLKLGYEIVCFNKGQQGDGKMLSPHDLKNCENNNN